jgi:sulfate permease, SulP family
MGITEPSDLRGRVIRSLVAGLTVSFVALSLGAAFGVLSGRGAFAGMISAAVIASITSALGGTRIQCSGPTGPMTTVMTALFAAVTGTIAEQHPGLNQDHFLNLTILLMAGLMLLSAILRLGRFISLIPNVVISGFMNGIAAIIWMDQVKRLFGLGGKDALEGSLAVNLAVVVGTTTLVFMIPVLARRWFSRFASLLSGTFLAIVIMTAMAALLRLEIERVELASSLRSWGDFQRLVASQIPTDWSWPIILTALPFALQLTVLGYLDTLMTALVIDKLTGEKTKPNQELAAQGLAHAAVAFVGGIPGAQATIRSVLMVKEGAAWRWAGVLVGILALTEMLVFQGYIRLIPQAVFAGVLIKVGYDVFDWPPLITWWKNCNRRDLRVKAPEIPAFSGTNVMPALRVSTLDLVFVFGTSLLTIFLDLNIAVAVFTSLFYLNNHVFNRNHPVGNLEGSQSFEDED